MPEEKNQKKLTPIFRAILEVSFIVFLFYSNLLMGEFTNSGLGQSNGLWWAIQNIFTKTNFLIAIVCGLIGHLIFEFFSSRL
jgi:Trk-type K+ transport system membrane component